MKKKNNNNAPADKTKVLLALAATTPAAPGPCPSHEQLASFTDGRLNPAERKRVMEHLDACRSCYEVWFYASDLETEELHPKISVSSKKVLPLRRIQSFAATGFGLAMAATLLFFVMTSNQQKTGLGNILEMSYQAAIEHNRSDETITLPWEQPDIIYGLAETRRNRPENRAFGAGLYAGRHLLSEEKSLPIFPDFLQVNQQGTEVAETWDDTRWASWYHLGKWCLLVHAVCLEGAESMPPGFWAEQVTIFEALQQAILGHDTDFQDISFIRKKMETLSSLLERVVADGINYRISKKIQQAINDITNHLSPMDS